MSRTISITIPDRLEQLLKAKADEIGISRSRYIGNILLSWQAEHTNNSNNCKNLQDGLCSVHGFLCSAPQEEAITCANYAQPSKEK